MEYTLLHRIPTDVLWHYAYLLMIYCFVVLAGDKLMFECRFSW
jgi:hypothetical protein